MSNQYNFKKEWESTKKQLVKFSKEAMDVVKKGEKEIVKFSKKTKLQIDTTAINLKKEKLYYLIGKEYVKKGNSSKQSVKMKKLIDELKSAQKDVKDIKGKLKETK